MSESKPELIEALNIADNFTLAMDEEIRQDGLAGSLCGFALELKQTPDIETLKQRIDKFSQHFPTAIASLQQRGKRFYWCKRPHQPQLFYQHNSPKNLTAKQFKQQTIDQIINHTDDRENIAPIEFHLIENKTFLIRWIHPFSDARGIYLIIKYLTTDDPAHQQEFLQQCPKPLVNQQLDKYSLWKKFTLLLKGKRYIFNIDKLQSIQPFQSNLKPQKLNYSTFRLTEAETAQVLKLSRQHTGLTGTSLYYIGCLMRALDKNQPEYEGDAYCAPYAFNLRKQGAVIPVVANHVCALFAQAPREIVKDRNALFSHLKNQNKNVIRQQLDYAFLPLMWAGSWLSLDKYGDILRLSSTGKERSSFWFSDVGQIQIPDNQFLGSEINALFHLCQVTTPPGLAFLCCIHQNQLTLSYNFVEPLANSKQIEQLHQLVLDELLGK